jgi:hypothetical protein
MTTIARVAVGAGGAVPALAVGLMAAVALSPATSLVAQRQLRGQIPPKYLRLYSAAAGRHELGPDGWSYLAAVGKVECDHGRSSAVGCHRGEVNDAGARGPAQFLDATWARYGVDGDGDGSRDVYEPSDAIFGMANYLRASGAPADWRGALFAYNHDDAYVDRVLRQAAEYRSAVLEASPVVEGNADEWLAPLPGDSGAACDRRIVPDVVALIRAYAVTVTACFAGAPHAVSGEHPLGLAVDLIPADGNWNRTLRLATDYGWSRACARAGCGGRGPFRVVLYNGNPGHGDPAHAASAHLHLSWEHAPATPFTRAAWVRTLLAGSSTGVSNLRPRAVPRPSMSIAPARRRR